MAGDWIKMRAALFTHPKVIRMTSALKADTLRTVGGLMSVWCLFDAHSIDGRLDGYTPEVLDDHLRWPGFSKAMIDVGWLESDGAAGLDLPRFDTHNGQSAKRRAQETERKRNARKVSASEADKKRTREEKRREDISSLRSDIDAAPSAAKPSRKKPATIDCPPGVNAQVWADFLAIRKAKRAPLTPTALQAIQVQAERAGLTLEGALRVCCARGWQGFNADWLKEPQVKTAQTESFRERDERLARERMAEVIGRPINPPGRDVIDITPDEIDRGLQLLGGAR